MHRDRSASRQSGANRDRSSSRQRTGFNFGPSIVSKEVMTEHSFMPTDITFVDSMNDLEVEQWRQVKAVADKVKWLLTEFAGSIHDLLVWKDLIFELPTLPQLPVSDVLLIVSKLYRRCSELTHGMSVFFGIVFGEDHADTDFHFTELRVIKREWAQLQKEYRELQEENHRLDKVNARLKLMLQEKDTEIDRRTQKTLEIEQSKVRMEEDMNRLLHQASQKMEQFDEEQGQRAALDGPISQVINTAAATMGQKVTGMQQSITTIERALQGLSTEIHLGGLTPEDKSNYQRRMKTATANLRAMGQEFTDTKEGFFKVSTELHKSVFEKKLAIEVSNQHLKAYGIQNEKASAARSKLADMQQHLTTLKRLYDVTFAHGEVHVDVTGEVKHPDRLVPGSGVSPASYVAEITREIQSVIDMGNHVRSLLDTEAESQVLAKAMEKSRELSRAQAEVNMPDFGKFNETSPRRRPLDEDLSDWPTKADDPNAEAVGLVPPRLPEASRISHPVQDDEGYSGSSGGSEGEGEAAAAPAKKKKKKRRSSQWDTLSHTLAAVGSARRRASNGSGNAAEPGLVPPAKAAKPTAKRPPESSSTQKRGAPSGPGLRPGPQPKGPGSGRAGSPGRAPRGVARSDTEGTARHETSEEGRGSPPASPGTGALGIPSRYSSFRALSQLPTEDERETHMRLEEAHLLPKWGWHIPSDVDGGPDEGPDPQLVPLSMTADVETAYLSGARTVKTPQGVVDLEAMTLTAPAGAVHPVSRNSVQPDGVRLIVDNLSPGTTEGRLRAALGDFEPGTVHIMRDPEGQSLGRGLVWMPETRASAVLEMEEVEVEGARATVSTVPTPLLKLAHRHAVVLRGLLPSVDEQTLGEQLSNFGEVEAVSVVRSEAGGSLGIGFAWFTTEDAAQRCVRLLSVVEGGKVGAEMVESSDTVGVKVEVHGLPEAVDEASLAQAFEAQEGLQAVGTQKCVSTDGVEENVGIVWYQTKTQAEGAVSAVQEIDGCEVRAEVASPPSPGRQVLRGKELMFGGDGRLSEVAVEGLPPDIDEGALKAAMQEYGAVGAVRLRPGSDGTAAATVWFEEVAGARNATLQCTRVAGRPVQLRAFSDMASPLRPVQVHSRVSHEAPGSTSEEDHATADNEDDGPRRRRSRHAAPSPHSHGRQAVPFSSYETALKGQQARLKYEFDAHLATMRGKYENRITALEAELATLKQRLDKVQSHPRSRASPATREKASENVVVKSYDVKFNSPNDATPGPSVSPGTTLPAVFTPFKGPKARTPAERQVNKQHRDVVRRTSVSSAASGPKPDGDTPRDSAASPATTGDATSRAPSAVRASSAVPDSPSGPRAPPFARASSAAPVFTSPSSARTAAVARVLSAAPASSAHAAARVLSAAPGSASSAHARPPGPSAPAPDTPGATT